MHACVYSIYYNNHHSNTGRTKSQRKNVVDGQSLFLYNKDKYQLYQKHLNILRITYPIIVEKR